MVRLWGSGRGPLWKPALPCPFALPCRPAHPDPARSPRPSPAAAKADEVARKVSVLQSFVEAPAEEKKEEKKETEKKGEHAEVGLAACAHVCTVPAGGCRGKCRMQAALQDMAGFMYGPCTAAGRWLAGMLQTCVLPPRATTIIAG